MIADKRSIPTALSIQKHEFKSQMDTSPTIQSGNSVLLEINGEKKLFVVAKAGGYVSFFPNILSQTCSPTRLFSSSSLSLPGN